MVEAQASQAPLAPDTPGTEGVPGLVSHIHGVLAGAYESWQQHREQRRAVTQIAAAIGGGVAAAETVNLIFNAEPVSASDNVPALSAEAFDTEPATPSAIERHPYEGPGSATASSLRQQCKTAALAAPEVIEKIPGTPYWGTVMADAGELTQSVGITLEVKEAMPVACREDFRKVGIGKVYLSDSKHRKPLPKMYKMGGIGPSIFFGGNKDGKRQGSLPQQAGDKNDDYECGDSVWLELDSELKSTLTHHVLAMRTRWHKIPVLNADGSSFEATHC